MSGTEGANHVKMEGPAGHCCVSAVLGQEAQLDPTDSKWDKLGCPMGRRGWNMVTEQGRHPQKSHYSKDYRILSQSVTKE